MTDALLTRLDRLGVRVTADGMVTRDGDTPPAAPPPPAAAIRDQLAALEARLRKGGAWLDTEHAWLLTHAGHADWDRRNAELDRQLARYTAMLDEYGRLEHALEATCD